MKSTCQGVAAAAAQNPGITSSGRDEGKSISHSLTGRAVRTAHGNAGLQLGAERFSVSGVMGTAGTHTNGLSANRFSTLDSLTAMDSSGTSNTSGVLEQAIGSRGKGSGADGAVTKAPRARASSSSRIEVADRPEPAVIPAYIAGITASVATSAWAVPIGSTAAAAAAVQHGRVHSKAVSRVCKKKRGKKPPQAGAIQTGIGDTVTAAQHAASMPPAVVSSTDAPELHPAGSSTINSTTGSSPGQASKNAQQSRKADGAAAVTCVASAAMNDERERLYCVVLCCCAVCSVLLLPCKHLVRCENCAEDFGSSAGGSRPLCPMCRVPIEQQLLVYMA